MAGEEIVGGIKGYLTMDADQFHREILRALAEVEALDGKKVDVRIDVHGDKVSKDLGSITRGLDGASSSARDLGTSFGSSGMRSGPLLIAGVVAGLALIGPVAGAATAAVGGFVGVVGGGVLAWRGFKDEIESGSAMGKELQGELDGVGAAVKRLQTTAAVGASGGVLAGLEHVREWLPSLNDDVSVLSTRLGSAFNISTQALTNGLDNAMPLLQDGAVYAEQFATWLNNAAQSQDFKDFVEYARAQLPAFVDAVVSLTKGFASLAEALAPLGEFATANLTVVGKSLEYVGKALGVVLAPLGDHGPLEWMKEARVDSLDLATATTAATTAATTYTPAVSAQAFALGTTNAALAAAKTAQDAHTAAAAQATANMIWENNAAGLLKQGLDVLNGVNLNVASAQTSSASATMTMTTALKASKGQLDLNSAAGIAARQAIEGKARADQNLATATATATGSTEAGTASLAASKTAALKAADASGTLTDEVRKYIEKLYAVPEVEKTKLEVDKAQAEASLAAFKASLASIHDKSVTVWMNQRFVSTGLNSNGGRNKAGGNTFDADGSIKFYANGGFSGAESHVAMIAPRGTTRVWNEPETGGEVYIPLAPTKRARSSQILAETNRLMGDPLQSGGGGSRVVTLDAASLQALVRLVSSENTIGGRASGQRSAFSPRDLYDAVYQAQVDYGRGTGMRSVVATKAGG